LDSLHGVRAAIGSLLQEVPYGVRNGLFFMFLLFLFTALLRKRWLAATAFVALFALPGSFSGDHVAVALAGGISIWVIHAFVLLRWGPLTYAVGYWFGWRLTTIPITTHNSAWYRSTAVWELLLLVAIAGWALRVATRRVNFARQT